MAMSQLEKDLKHRYFHIKSRCYNPNDKAYHNYGGRGIRMCDEWLNDINSFIEWALSHGYKKELAIDRKENNGDYSPDNCRFITLKENNQNRRSTKFFTYQGETLNLMQWCEKLGLSYNTVLMRIRRGWSFEKAISTEIRTRDTTSDIGKRYGRLVVTRFVGIDRFSQSIFECKCDCGNIVKVKLTKLRSGSTRSCGCLQREIASENLTNYLVSTKCKRNKKLRLKRYGSGANVQAK